MARDHDPVDVKAFEPCRGDIFAGQSNQRPNCNYCSVGTLGRRVGYYCNTCMIFLHLKCFPKHRMTRIKMHRIHNELTIGIDTDGG